MGWTLNKLTKTTAITYTPGSPAIPGTEGTAGIPSYTYWDEVITGGGQVISTLPPEGYQNPIYVDGQLVGGSGGWRYFGTEIGILVRVETYGFVYTLQIYTASVLVTVPAVPPIPAVPGVPATPATIASNYNLGWNAGATGPANLAVDQVMQWRFSAGAVGVIVGLAKSIDPQDQGYLGMDFGVMASSGLYQFYKAGVPITSPVPFTNGDTFSIHRKAAGEIVVALNGGVIYQDTITSLDVVVDVSLYSGDDVVWDAQELAITAAVINANISGSTLSDAAAVGTAIAITRTLGPGTQLGIADATTMCGAYVGQVLVNGSVYVGPPPEPPPPPPPPFG